MAEHKTLGNLLIEKGIITQDQLKRALSEQKVSGKLLGTILVELGYATEEDIASQLSEQMGLAFIDLTTYQVDKDIITIIPEKIARRFNAIPLFKVGNMVTVAMENPLDIQSVDEINRITGLEIQPVFGTKSAIASAIDKYYGTTGELKEAIENIQEQQEQEETQRVIEIDETQEKKDSPAIKLVNLIIAQAVKDGASDIHFEPEEKQFRIRARVDGVLHEIEPSPPKNLESAIISRVKVMCNMNIAEKRLPQDGRIKVKVASKSVDLRVSSFPTIHGENIVIRILDRSNVLMDIGQLGLSKESMEILQEIIRSPNGVILVTGPTGSGKTTTLYAFLSTINSLDKNILTMEDPVEYRLSGVRQSQVDVKAGLTFAVGLRSIVRQDPDVILIGEVRDIETAEIAIQSALTGHLVFSTLHTNDAPSAATRLIDMGVEPFLISSSLKCVVAQRLIRLLCPKCREPYKPDMEILKKLDLSPTREYTFFREKGCDSCKQTGYKGRMGIFEIMLVNDEIKEMIVHKESSNRIMKACVANGMKTLRQDGIRKIVNGDTSLAEVLRLT
ncbi:MAG: Flp pilus assembly complex ATPase component TadA [Candidatus Aureabacteria bacterium]|nr:Flp pilus assembly complex ATPase component TadA [Candidatus Auribacterota bacterium]